MSEIDQQFNFRLPQYRDKDRFDKLTYSPNTGDKVRRRITAAKFYPGMSVDGVVERKIDKDTYVCRWDDGSRSTEKSKHLYLMEIVIPD